MNADEFKSNLVKRLRAEKSRQGLTCRQIADETIRIEKPVSEKTVRRLFAVGKEDYNFHLATLQAVAIVLGVDAVAADMADVAQQEAQRLAAQLETVQTRLESAQELLNAKNEQIAQLSEEMEQHKAHVDSMRTTVHAQRRTIRRLTVLLTAVLVVVALLFATDMLTPSLGFFRRLL